MVAARRLEHDAEGDPERGGGEAGPPGQRAVEPSEDVHVGATGAVG